MKCAIQWGKTKLNGTFHLSLNEIFILLPNEKTLEFWEFKFQLLYSNQTVCKGQGFKWTIPCYLWNWQWHFIMWKFIIFNKSFANVNVGSIRGMIWLQYKEGIMMITICTYQIMQKLASANLAKGQAIAQQAGAVPQGGGARGQKPP